MDGGLGTSVARNLGPRSAPRAPTPPRSATDPRPSPRTPWPGASPPGSPSGNGPLWKHLSQSSPSSWNCHDWPTPYLASPSMRKTFVWLRKSWSSPMTARGPGSRNPPIRVSARSHGALAGSGYCSRQGKARSLSRPQQVPQDRTSHRAFCARTPPNVQEPPRDAGIWRHFLRYFASLAARSPPR